MSIPRAIAALTANLDVCTWNGQGDGLPLYIGEQPQSPVDCVTLFVEPDGRAPDPDLDDDDSLGRTCDLRWLVRHSGDATGHTAPGQAAAQRILDALHGLTHTTATDTQTGTVVSVTHILARNSVPTPLGPDPAGNHEWTVVHSCDYDRGA